MSKELSMPIPWVRHVQDLSNRVWVLQNQTLTAVPRKEHTVPVTVTLLPCQRPETLEKNKGDPMFLGLKEPNCCLFCRKDGEKPVLQLSKENIMDLYNEKKPMKPFLFYHNKSGRTSAFESAAFDGWFIAVNSQGSCPLVLTQDLGQAYVTDFELTMVP